MRALTRSGRASGASVATSSPIEGAAELSVGAAFNLDIASVAVTFLRFTAEGTKEVASFFRSRSSGAAKTDAAAISAAAVGFAGNEGFAVEDDDGILVGFAVEDDDGILVGFAGKDGCGGAS